MRQPPLSYGALTLALLLTACSDPKPSCPTCGPETTNGFIETTGDLPLDGPPSPITDAAPPPDTLVSVGEAASACKLPARPEAAIGLGFPQADDRLATTGTVRGTVLFADFPDQRAAMSPSEVFDILSPGAERYFDTVSYGRMSLELSAHPVWLRLSQPAAHYAEGIKTYSGHRAFLDEALRLADDAVDFSQTDVIILMSAPSADVIAYGPTWMGNQGSPLVADGRRITTAITSGADLLYWGSPWLNHELGHSMGLPDLYSYEGDGGFTRPFSLMDYIAGEAPGLLAWERWQLGWLDDAQILCNPSDGVSNLAPLDAEGGVKAIVIRRSQTRAVVVESRRARGLDHALSAPGVVVYEVDASLASGYAPIVVANGQRALALGQALTVGDVGVKFVDSVAPYDTVEIGTR